MWIRKKNASSSTCRRRKYRAILFFFLFADVLGIAGFYLIKINNAIPGQLSIVSGESACFSFSVPANANVYRAQSEEVCGQLDLSQPFSIKGSDQPVRMEVNLFGVFPFKTVTVNVVDKQQVAAVGIPIGIYVRTQGVMVIDVAEVRDEQKGMVIPGEHIIKSGDYILEVNGEPVASRYDIISMLKHLKNEQVTLLIQRDGSKMEVQLSCADTQDGYKLGVWIRDDMQGIGTLTYTKNLQYGALGHSITDQDTGERVELSDSTLYQATILNIKKGQQGSPGELGGMISYGHAFAIGTIEENTSHGIFGTLYGDAEIPGEMVEVAYKQEIKEGEAYVRSWVSGEAKDYKIRIKKVNMGKADSSKGLEIEVTDQDLIELTGGIVQGMSGSPILQDGKIIGAVTHVFVNDPKKGYGIFIEDMLNHT